MDSISAPSLWKRYFIFCGVGASGLLVDMGLFHLLHLRFGWPLEVSKLAAAEIALLNNFLWNDCWTFGHRPIESDAPWPRRSSVSTSFAFPGLPSRYCSSVSYTGGRVSMRK